MSICEVCLGVIAPLGGDNWAHQNLLLDDHIAIPLSHAGTPVGHDPVLNMKFIDALDALEQKDESE